MIIQYVIGDYVTLGQKLKSLREGKALTQTQLSEELNCLISQGKLSDIENDKRIPDFIEMCKMCEYFKIEPNTVWNDIKYESIYEPLILSTGKGEKKRMEEK